MWDLVIVHLSDLHFCPAFANRKQPFYEIKGHDFLLLQALQTAYRQILGGLKTDGKGNYPENFLVVLTGDITTDGKAQSFRNAVNFLKKSIPVIRNENRLGLAIPDDNLLIVPGNHDVWVHYLHDAKVHFLSEYSLKRPEPSRLFNDSFDIEPPFVVQKQINGIALSILGLDSNVPIPRAFSLENVFGRGHVGKQQIHVADRIMCSSTENCLRIGLLHHHLMEVISEDKRLKLFDADQTLNYLTELGTGMILCGHRHLPHCAPMIGGKNSHSFYYSCTGSATQTKSKHGNHFSVYRIKKSGKKFALKNELYKFDDVTGFHVVANEDYELC